MNIRFYVSLTLLILLAYCGCRGSSEIEMKQALNAMDQAKELRADVFAPTDFQKAQENWEHALAAEKEGRTGNAKVLFSSAKIFFGKAADIAKSKREALSKELDRLQIAVGANLAQVKIDLSTKALSPKQRSQVEALVSEVDEGNASIKKMQAKEELAQAIATAKELQTKIYHAQLILAGQKIH